MRRSLLSIVMASSVLATSVRSQDESASSASKQQTRAREVAEYAAREAKRYVLYCDDENAEPLKRVPQPVLRFSNPVRGEIYGSVYLWTHKGRPSAVGSIYRFYRPLVQVNVELQSLCASALIVKRNGEVCWTPAKSGVTFQSLPQGPSAANTTKGRQLQMRGLARQFSAEAARRDENDQFSPLRLMARPLHYYETTDGADGAVFVFTTANDPEVMLLIESRLQSGRRQWYFAAARMHFCHLRLIHSGKTVWEVPQVAPPWEPLRGPQGHYVVLDWKDPAAADID